MSCLGARHLLEALGEAIDVDLEIGTLRGVLDAIQEEQASPTETGLEMLAADLQPSKAKEIMDAHLAKPVVCVNELLADLRMTLAQATSACQNVCVCDAFTSLLSLSCLFVHFALGEQHLHVAARA